MTIKITKIRAQNIKKKIWLIKKERFLYKNNIHLLKNYVLTSKNKSYFINFYEIFKKAQKRLKKGAKKRGGNFRLVNIENDHFLGGLFPTPLFRRLERSPIQFPIILALPRRVRNGSSPKFVIFWLSRGAPFWAPLRALLRALNSAIFNRFEKYSLLHKIFSTFYKVYTCLHKKEALDFTKLLKTL